MRYNAAHDTVISTDQNVSCVTGTQLCKVSMRLLQHAGTGDTVHLRRQGVELVFRRQQAADFPGSRLHYIFKHSFSAIQADTLSERFTWPLTDPFGPTSQGFIEYWSGSTYSAPAPPVVSFTMKLDTDLFDLAKGKTTAKSLEVRLSILGCLTSPRGQLVVNMARSPNRLVRWNG
jgi:hypothetical protein